MNLLIGGAAGLAGAAVALLLAGSMPTTVRRGKGTSIEAAFLLAAAGGALTGGALTGGGFVVDLVMAAGIGALGAWAAARASHLPVAAVAVLSAVLLGLTPLAAAGAGVAVAVAVLRTRLPLLKALAGGLVAAGLLVEVGPRGGSWPEAFVVLMLIVLAGTAAARGSDRMTRVFSIAVGAGLSLIVLAAAGFLLAAIPAFADLSRAVRLSEGAAASLAAGSTDPDPSLAIAADAFGSAQQRLDSPVARLVDFVPWASQNARALRALAGAGEQVARTASEAAAGPDQLGLMNGGVDLQALDRTGAAVGRTHLAVGQALESLRASRSPALLPPIADGSSELQSRLTDAWPALDDLNRGLKLLPQMLGADGSRRYLLLLQTPAEARASGGIVGSYAVLEADGGKVSLARTGSAGEDLNRAGDPPARAVEGADEYLARYGSYLPLQFWQNVTLGPDWPTVSLVADQNFPQSGGQPIDGVIGLDPYALAAILRVTGPVDVPPWPVPISADNVIPVLMHEQYTFFPNPERREFLADVTAVVFERLTGDQGAAARPLAVALAEVARSKNALAWMENPAEQDLMQRLSADGGFEAPRGGGDSLAVVTQNSSGNKIDWFLRRALEYDVTFDPQLGRSEAVLRISLTNEAPSRGLPDYVIGSAGPPESRTARGENRTLLSVYSPLDLGEATLDGAALEMTRAEELGHQVYSAFVIIPPGGTVVAELRLAGPIDPVDGAYRLELRRQTLAVAEPVSISLGFTDGWKGSGSNRRSVVLDRDRTARFGYERAGD